MPFPKVRKVLSWIPTLLWILLAESLSFLSWVVNDLLLRDLCVDCLLPSRLQQLFVVRLQLPTGVAVGRRSWFWWVPSFVWCRILRQLLSSLFFPASTMMMTSSSVESDVVTFTGIQYATAKRFEAPKLLSQNYERSLNLSPTCFPQSVKAHGLDTPILKSIAKGWLDKKRQGYSGSEVTGHQLNIWTPADALFQEEQEGEKGWSSRERRKAPVVVFFHGGAFVFGSCHVALQSGENWAKRGVCFVSANYRLGVFGYLRAPGVDSNCGLRDQIAVLEWVRENIAAFGGDPANVTVAGQSAGSISCQTLVSVSGVVGGGGDGGGGGLAHRIFAMSGGSVHVQTRAQARRVFADFGKVCKLPLLDDEESTNNNNSGSYNNINNGNDDDDHHHHDIQALRRERTVVEHLRSLSTVELLKLQKIVEDDVTIAYRRCEHNGLMPFSPAIDQLDYHSTVLVAADEQQHEPRNEQEARREEIISRKPVLIPTNPIAKMMQENISLPTLTGTTDTEYTFFTGFVSPSARLASKWQKVEDSHGKVLKRLKQWSEELPAVTDEDRRRVLEKYAHGKFKERCGESTPLWNAFNGDFIFRVPVELFASAVANGTRDSTTRRSAAYVYCFDQQAGLLPQQLLSPHILDIFYWFGHLGMFPYLCGPFALLSPSHWNLSRFMMGMAEGFVRGEGDATPSPSGAPEEKDSTSTSSSSSSVRRLWKDLAHSWKWDPEKRQTLFCNARRHQLIEKPDDDEVTSWKPFIDAILSSS